MIFHGRDAVIRHDRFATQFYDMYDRNAVLRHVLVRTQFHDMPWPVQFYDIIIIYNICIAPYNTIL